MDLFFSFRWIAPSDIESDSLWIFFSMTVTEKTFCWRTTDSDSSKSTRFTVDAAQSIAYSLPRERAAVSVSRAADKNMGPHKDDDDDDDKHRANGHKKKMRKRRPQQHGWWQHCLPTHVVCSAGTGRDPPSSVVVEWGLLLSVATLMLWLLGFSMTLSSLPSTLPSRLGRLAGAPLNLANPSELEHAIREQQRGLVSDQAGERSSVAISAGTTFKVPPSHWPVSLRSEDESTYDSITHPGDNVTVMSLPPFWSAPVHNGKLMTRAQAMQIGSCLQSDNLDNHSVGEACPVDQRTIFVAIASYRDFECRSTVESIYLRAAHPERIRVAVVDQIVSGEDARCDAPIVPCDTHPDQALCKYAAQVDVYEMKAELSIGPVFARHIGYRMYRGEYYATQSDAHVTFTTNWDADIILQLESTKNDMAVLSTYLTDVQGSISPEGHSLLKSRPIMCNTDYEGGAQGMHLRHGSQPERVPSIHGSPQLQPWWAAGYSFSRGHFVVNVPYDWLQPMIFQGEEMSIGIRGFTIGYDYYAPERSVCFHHYSVGENARVRSKVHHFWENDNKYAGTGRRAMKRLLGIVHMNPEEPLDSWDHAGEDVYGVGGVRTPEKFYETFGIDVAGKTVEHHLCRFVDLNGRMHNEFTPHLREDGMGIDYGAIHFKFKDPAPDEK